ncbi:hypothetical protein ACWF82_28050 [Nocardia sp. NPDC055053]
MIEPVIPPRTPLQERIHGPLPVRFIRHTTDPEIIYGFAVVGDAGRVTDRAALAALGWLPGTRLTVSCPEDRLILVREATDGNHCRRPRRHRTSSPDLRRGDPARPGTFVGGYRAYLRNPFRSTRNHCGRNGL